MPQAAQSQAAQDGISGGLLSSDLDDYQRCMLRVRAGASSAAVSAKRRLATSQTAPLLRRSGVPPGGYKVLDRAWERAWLESRDRAPLPSERSRQLDKAASKLIYEYQQPVYQLAQHLDATHHLAYHTFQRPRQPRSARSPPPPPAHAARHRRQGSHQAPRQHLRVVH